MPEIAVKETDSIPTLLPIGKIVPNPRNPREVTEADVAELAPDVKHRGVLQPICVRPVDHKWELIYGARRLKAAQLAGYTSIHAIVRECDERQADELMVVENVQRKDFHPLDEAKAYGLLEAHGNNVKGIAALASKPYEYVLRRLHLRNLGAEGVKLFREGKIGLEAALSLCRVQAADQARCIKEVTHYRSLTAGEVAHWLDNNVFLDLKEAPFSTDDATLYPKAGACEEEGSRGPLLRLQAGALVSASR
jgi:ParB/RepB/Spo0J family partition protein